MCKSKLKVGDRVAATGDIPFWHTVTGVVQKVVGDRADVLIDADAVYADGGVVSYRGKVLENSTVWELIPPPPPLTDKELADEYRVASDRALEVRKELESRGFQCFRRSRDVATAQFYYVGTSPGWKDVEFRKTVITEEVV